MSNKKRNRTVVSLAVITGCILTLCADTFAINCYEEVDPYYWDFNVPSMIHINSVNDVAGVRQQMRDIIWWKTDSYPATKGPSTIGVVVPVPDWVTQIGSNNVDSVQKMDILMDYQMHSYAYLIHPKTSVNRLLIYHQGHDDSLLPWGGQGTMKFFLDRGFTVLAFRMPLFGENSLTAYNVPGRGTVTFPHNGHDQLVPLESETGGNGLRFFWEPIIVGINYVEQNYNFRDITMTGCSGGGQSTHFGAALDTRIGLSFPTAGGLPSYLTGGPCPMPTGDAECTWAPFFDNVSWLDVYILGGYGQNRGQAHILNKYDSCCWWGVGYQTYEPYVTAAVDNLGLGFYYVYLDDSHQEHTISSVVHNEVMWPLIAAHLPPETCTEVLGAGWGMKGDVNHDCYVTFEDFAMFAGEWLKCLVPDDPQCDKPWQH